MAKYGLEFGYCCKEFMDSYYLNGLFGRLPGSSKYHLWHLNPAYQIDINYCPWCAKSVPWKEIDDRES